MFEKHEVMDYSLLFAIEKISNNMDEQTIVDSENVSLATASVRRPTNHTNHSRRQTNHKKE